MCQPLFHPALRRKCGGLRFFKPNTPQGDGQPETVGRRSTTASFRHCCLIKWLSGNASLGFSRYWARGGLYSTFGHQFALRRRKSSRRGRVYPAAMSAVGRLTDRRSARQQRVYRRCLQLDMRSIVRVGERLLFSGGCRIDMRKEQPQRRMTVSSSSSCHRTCLSGCRCLAHAPCPRRIAQSGMASTGRTGQPKIARQESRHPPELHFSDEPKMLGGLPIAGRRTSCLLCSVSFRRLAQQHPPEGREQKPKVTVPPGVCTHSPRARTVWPVDAQWGGRARLLLHGARDLLPRVVCSHQGNGYE